MAHVVGEKGQVVIEHRRSLRGRLESYAKRSVPVEEWAQAREEAWAAAVGEDAGR